MFGGSGVVVEFFEFFGDDAEGDGEFLGASGSPFAFWVCGHVIVAMVVGW